MARQVLYFPYISVPEEAWFTRTLLYWDAVGSIVPAPYAEKPARLSPYMRELLAAKLVVPVSPEHHERELGAPLEHFLEYVDEQVRAGMVEPGLADAPPAARGTAQAGTVFEIHRGKLSHYVAEGLVERRLAHRVAERNWYAVEARVAAQFMAYLATALGACVKMDPITDSASHLFTFSGTPAGAADEVKLLQEMRAGVLESMLPAPVEPVSVAEIASFKDRYGTQLSSFRREVEDRLVDLAMIDSEWARAKKLESVQEDLDARLSELQARMEERHWPTIILGTVCGLVAAAIPGVREAVAGHEVAAGLAVPGLISTMYLGIPQLRASKASMQSPLAYAALAHRQLGG